MMIIRFEQKGIVKCILNEKDVKANEAYNLILSINNLCDNNNTYLKLFLFNFRNGNTFHAFLS